MAEFASNLLQIASGVAGSQGSGLTEGIKEGLALAQRAEQVQMEREKLNMQREELKNARLTKFMDDVQKVTQYKTPGSRNGYIRMMKSNRDRLGLQDTVTDEALEAMKLPENIGRQITLRNQYRAGQIDYETVIKTLQDPAKLALIKETPEEFWSEDPIKEISISDVTDQIEKDKAQKAAAQSKQGGVDNRYDRSQIVTLGKDFKASVKAQKDHLQSAQNVLTLLNQKKGIADSAVRVQLAKLSGNVGALSDFDVKSWGGDPALLEKAEQYLSTQVSGNLTPENRKQMKDIAIAFQKIIKNRIRVEAENTLDMGEAAGADRGKLTKALGVDRIVGPPEKVFAGKQINPAALPAIKKSIAANPAKKSWWAKSLGMSIEELNAALGGK